MSQSLLLSVQSPDATNEEIALFTRELNQFISENITDCEISKPEVNIKPGEKGVAEVFNSLNILFGKLDFLNTFAECLSIYIKERRRSVNITVSNKAGTNLTFSAENLGKTEISDLVNQLHNLANAKSD